MKCRHQARKGVCSPSSPYCARACQYAGKLGDFSVAMWASVALKRIKRIYLCGDK